MGLDNLRKTIAQFAPLTGNIQDLQKDLDEAMEESNISTPDRKLYNDHTNEMFTALKSGNIEKARKLALSGQKKMKKIVNNAGKDTNGK